MPAAKAFVVTDFAPNVVAIYRLLKAMDKPQPKPSTTTGKTIAVALEHADATDLAGTLTRHFGVAPPAPQRRPQAPMASRIAAPRITADARTNQILVTGDDAQIEAVKSAITMLDLPVPVPSVSATLIRLKHIEAGRAASTLMSLAHGSSFLWSASGVKPAVVAHSETNALLVSAAKPDLAQIKQLVAEMDVKKE